MLRFEPWLGYASFLFNKIYRISNREAELFKVFSVTHDCQYSLKRINLLAFINEC